MTDYTELDLDGDSQDIVLRLMIEDPNFLGQCLRKGIEPKLFSSEVRQKIAVLVVGFYQSYREAPGVGIADIISSEMSKNILIKIDDGEMYVQFIDKLFGLDMHGVSSEYLLDRLDLFIKKRVVATTTSKLVALSERVNINPDKHLDLMREAVELTNRVTGRQLVQSITEDTIFEDRRVLTKFGVEGLDKALGGGLRRGVFGLIQAYTSVGKTWCITHLAKMATRLGTTPLVMPLEASNRQYRLRQRMSFTGMTESELRESPVKAIQQVKVSLIKKSDVLILDEDEKSLYVDDIPGLVEEIEYKYNTKIELILMDSLDDVMPQRGKRYANPLDATDDKYTFMKNYTKDTERCGMTTVQSKAEGEGKFWLTSGTVGLGFVKARKATVGISINASPQEIDLGLARLYLFKHTDGPVGSKFWIRQDFTVGQFVTDFGRYERFVYDEMLKQCGAELDGKG